MSASISALTTSEQTDRPALTRAGWSKVSLVAFPHHRLRELWGWLRQDPASNFDDTAPEDYEAFRAHQLAFAGTSRQLWGVEIDGELLGAIGFERLSRTTAMLRGICFDRTVHGSGAPRHAVARLLELAWASGYRKISARYFVSNRRIRSFLQALCAVDEGYLKQETDQNGKPIDVRLVAFFAPKGAE